MDLPNRKKLVHTPPSYIRPEEAVFFITICCRPKGQNQLCHSDIAKSIFETVSFRHSRKDWWMHLILLMPDHLHTLVSFPSDKNMQAVISQWKEYTAKKLAIQWQRDFFEHRLRTEESLQDKSDYVLLNPVRRGLIEKPNEWPYVWQPEI